MIENSTENLPFKIVRAHISKADYIDVIRSNGPHLGASFLWLTEQVHPQMPKDELGYAFGLASDELRCRLCEGRNFLRPNSSLVPGSDKYAYRVIARGTTRLDLGYNVPQTLAMFHENLEMYGIDYPGCEDSIFPRTFWFYNTVPIPQHIRPEINNIILVMTYRNERFVLPSSKKDGFIAVVDLSGPDAKGVTTQIQIAEANEEQLPTLRDLLIGLVEVHLI